MDRIQVRNNLVDWVVTRSTFDRVAFVDCTISGGRWRDVALDDCNFESTRMDKWRLKSIARNLRLSNCVLGDCQVELVMAVESQPAIVFEAELIEVSLTFSGGAVFRSCQLVNSSIRISSSATQITLASSRLTNVSILGAPSLQGGAVSFDNTKPEDVELVGVFVEERLLKQIAEKDFVPPKGVVFRRMTAATVDLSSYGVKDAEFLVVMGNRLLVVSYEWWAAQKATDAIGSIRAALSKRRSRLKGAKDGVLDEYVVRFARMLGDENQA